MSQKEYFAKWYELNRERLSNKRKDRYNSDPEYRERVLTNSRKSRKSKERPVVQVVTVSGQDYNALSIAEACEKIGISVETMIKWEKSKVVPATPFRLTGRRTRWYTHGMVDVIAAAVSDRTVSTGKRVRISYDDAEFVAKIVTGWSALPELAS